MTALVAHKRIMDKTCGETKLVKIALVAESESTIKIKTLTGMCLDIDIDLDATIE